MHDEVCKKGILSSIGYDPGCTSFYHLLYFYASSLRCCYGLYNLEAEVHQRLYFFQYTSKLSFWKGFYLTIHTVLQVGLGDITPDEEWPTFVFVMPLVLVGDVLSSYLHYYIHVGFVILFIFLYFYTNCILYCMKNNIQWFQGIYRLQLHKLALCVTGCHVRNEEDVPKGQELVMANSVADFVTITNHTMPLRATSAEIMRREVPDLVKLAKMEKKKKTMPETPKKKETKVEEEQEDRLATPPESDAKEDDTQDCSQNYLIKKKGHLSPEKASSRARSKNNSHKAMKTGNSATLTTVVDEELKTPKLTSWRGKMATRTGSFGNVNNQKKMTREMTTPLLHSMEPADSQEKISNSKIKGKSRERLSKAVRIKDPAHHHPPKKKPPPPAPRSPPADQLKTSREPDKDWFE